MSWEITLSTFAAVWAVSGIKSAVRMFIIISEEEDRIPPGEIIMLLSVSLAAGPLIDGIVDGVNDTNNE